MSSRRIVYSDSLTGDGSTSIVGSRDGRYRFTSKSYAVATIIMLMFRLPFTGRLLVFGEGGGNIIQYFVVSAFVFLPMLYMFLFIGHYSKMGCMVLGRIVPLIHGIGYTMMFLTCLAVVNEITVAVDGINYLKLSMSSDLPWMNCHTNWGKNCLGKKEMEECLKNETECFKDYTQFSATKYKIYVSRQFGHDVQREPSFVEDGHIWNKIIGHSVLYLLICCFIILLVSDLTISVNNKLSIVAFSIYVGSFVAFIILMAPNLKNKHSLVYMFRIRWDSLVSKDSWYNAMMYFVMMINTSNAGCILLGSYLPSSAMADLIAFVAWIGTMFLYLLADFMYCCLLGAISEKLGSKLLEMLVPGNAGMMIIFPQFLGTFNFSPQLICFLYFLLVISSSLFRVKLLMASIYHTLADVKPIIKIYQFYIRIFSCVFLFLLTMPICIVDLYWIYYAFISSLEVSLSAFVMIITCSCILYIYGTQTLCDDHHFMYGSQPATFFKITLFTIPIVFMPFGVLLFMDMADYYTFRPTAAILLYVTFLLGICLQIFGLVYVSIYYLKRQNMAHLIRCEDTWGDPNSNTRKERLIYHPRKETNYFRRIDECKHECLRYKKVIVYIVKEEEVLHTEGYKELDPNEKLFSNPEVGIKTG